MGKPVGSRTAADGKGDPFNAWLYPYIYVHIIRRCFLLAGWPELFCARGVCVCRFVMGRAEWDMMGENNPPRIACTVSTLGMVRSVRFSGASFGVPWAVRSTGCLLGVYVLGRLGYYCNPTGCFQGLAV